MNLPMHTIHQSVFSPIAGITWSTSLRRRTHLRTIQDLLDQGELEPATLAAQALMSQAPYDIHALALMAQCLATKGDHLAAVQIYDRQLAQQDSDVIWAAKAHSLAALGRHCLANTSFARATALARGTRFLAEQAECLLVSGRLNDALTALETAPTTSKDDLPRQLVHTKILIEKGKTHAAFNIASGIAISDKTGRAICLARQSKPTGIAFPTLCQQAISSLSTPHILAEIAWDHPQFIGTEQVDNLIQITADPKCGDSQKAHAHLALFRVHDQADDGFQTLAHLRNYHTLSAKNSGYRRSADSALFTLLMQLKIAPLLASKSKVLPIFITGLPGSGRQLAQRVLVQAADCGPARALSVVPAIMSRFIRQVRERGITRIERQDLLNLQAELREGLCQAASGSDVIVDTTASNFKWSGLIAAALPEARVVHMKADKMTTGWALHKGGWIDPDFGCQHDLKQIQAFQHRSNALMTHWEGSFAPNVMAISGDALSRPSGATAQAMVEACELKWSSHCIQLPCSPDRSWHRYAAYLNPLRRTPRISLI